MGRSRRIDWVEADAVTDADRRMIPGMQADVILESWYRWFIFDTKCATSTLSRRAGVDVGKPDSNNLYQLLAHLRNRDAKQLHGPKHEGMLLYPQVDRQLRADIRLEGIRIQARTVDLSRQWRAIHNEMREVIAG